MKQKIVIVLALVLCATCLTIGMRGVAGGATAYLYRTAWVSARPSTSVPRTRVSQGTQVMVLVVKSNWAQIQRGRAKGYVQKRYLSRTTQPITPSWRRKVEKLDWSKGGSTVLKKGGYATLYDIDTGIIVKIKRLGGSNHADVEPATSADTVKLKRIAGGQSGWESHAVVLINGDRYIAAGINTMPHGGQTIKDNGYPGQFCLHLSNSRTHGTDAINVAHQASIERVMAWAMR